MQIQTACHQGTPPSPRFNMRMLAANTSLYIFGGVASYGALARLLVKDGTLRGR